MKRILGLGLTLAMILTLLTGCGAGSAAPTGKTQVHQLLGGASETVGPALNLEVPEVAVTRVQEYGELTAYTTLEGVLTAKVNYPDGDVAALDEAVLGWIGQMEQNFLGQLDPERDNGSFIGDYDSYEVNGRVVSVHMTGRLTQSHDRQPKRVTANFHADRATGELLHLSDLLEEGGEERLKELVLEQIGVYPYGQSMLSTWLLTPEGLRVYIPDGTEVNLTYEELEGILTLPENKDGTGHIDPDKPMVALTFDDGPYDKVDSRLLDLLAENNAKATFFVVGDRVSAYPDTILRMVSDGHEIGIHTWEHATLTKLDEAGILRQINLTQEALQETAGYTCSVLRPPGGAYNDFVKQVVGSQGIYLANWSVDTLDWKYRDADSVYEKVMAQVYDGAIILCHDLYPSTAEAMERVIPELVARGYQLVTVSELISLSDGGIVAGKMYLDQ